MKKKRVSKAKVIRPGRPASSRDTLRTYLPGVRVLAPQYRKIMVIAHKNKASISATVRGLLEKAL